VIAAIGSRSLEWTEISMPFSLAIINGAEIYGGRKV
jgi:hypothetical protein